MPFEESEAITLNLPAGKLKVSCVQLGNIIKVVSKESNATSPLEVGDI
jgi:hypothetical protein